MMVGVQITARHREGVMSRMNLLGWGAIAVTVAIVSAVGALSQNNSNTSSNTEALASTGWRVAEPITYKNMSIFPVVSDRRASAETRQFTTLDEALSSGEAVIKERKKELTVHSAQRHGRLQEPQGASVGQLVLIYHGSKQLLLLAGELVQGGEQDRIIYEDRIVPAGGDPLPLDVFCVEQGRWSSGEYFASGRMMAHPSVREKAAVDREQTQVWQAVLAGSTALAAGASAAGVASRTENAQANAGEAALVVGSAPPPTNTTTVTVSAQTVSTIVATEASTKSYARIYRSSRVESSVHPFVKEIEKRFGQRMAELKGEQVVGVVVAYGSDIAWSDIFASTQLFERYWPKLRRSYVVEALARPQTNEHPSLDAASAFLQPLNGQGTAENGSGDYNLWRVMQPEYVRIDLEALRQAPVDLHRVKIHRTSVTQ
jgi:ARG/rhodanese/phosphatase superfamily protein